MFDLIVRLPFVSGCFSPPIGAGKHARTHGEFYAELLFCLLLSAGSMRVPIPNSQQGSQEEEEEEGQSHH